MTAQLEPVFVYDAIRTPRAKAKETGGLHALNPLQLLENQYEALQARTGLDPVRVDDVLLGCVTQMGEQAGNIAKVSTAFAGWPETIPGATIQRYCSSGVDAVRTASLAITAGAQDVIVAGGVEMMSRVKMMSDDATAFSDPEIAARAKVVSMGNGADLIATELGISRDDVDAVAVRSQQRAAAAIAAGRFTSVIPVGHDQLEQTCAVDECVRPDTTPESLASLEPAFARAGAMGIDAFQLSSRPYLAEIDHVHTAGNSPAMADAASLVLLGSEALAAGLAVEPRARILATAATSGDAMQVLGGCIDAAERALSQAGLDAADVDVWQMHEAFAATVLLAEKRLGLDPGRLNPNGGVIALGHPMGATGAILLGMALDELERTGGRFGLAAASGAAGVGSAVLFERI